VSYSPAVTDEPTTVGRGKRPIGWGKIVLLAFVYPFAAVVFAMLIRIGGVEAFESEGPSMEPTLQNGDRFVVDKTAYGLFLPWSAEAAINWGEPERGDVVVIRSPSAGIDIVKRVVGISGDVIAFTDNHLSINGEVVPQTPQGQCMELSPSVVGDSPPCFEEVIGDRSYLTSWEQAPLPTAMDPVEVPPDQVFILGDHRDRSNDSRYFGPVPVTAIKGRALFIYMGHHFFGAVR